MRKEKFYQKCLNCRYCIDGQNCDYKQEEIKYARSQSCNEYWAKAKVKNNGFSILGKDDFDSHGHQI